MGPEDILSTEIYALFRVGERVARVVGEIDAKTCGGYAHRLLAKDKACVAADAAISSPLLETTIDGAQGVILNITGCNNLSLFEVNEAAKIVEAAADKEANIIFGAGIDESMTDEVKITVIATGFEPRAEAAPATTSEVGGKTVDTSDVDAIFELFKR